MSPVATVAQTAMQQDDWRAGPKSAIPDASTVILDITQFVGEGKWRGPGRLESNQLVIVRFHKANVSAYSAYRYVFVKTLSSLGAPLTLRRS
jgi:hypothetical protein